MSSILKVGSFAALFAGVVLFGMKNSYADGKATFTAKCAVCHGADGKGKPAMKGTNFAEAKGDCAAITKSGKPPMPKFEGKLTDDEIKEVCAYIKTLK